MIQEKLNYDQNRHYDILVNGQKVKILNYSIKPLPSGETQLELKTKVRGTVLTECPHKQDSLYFIEIPTAGELLKIKGQFAGALSAPEMVAVRFTIMP